jgi:predicted naringenin-chalcone synthase
MTAAAKGYCEIFPPLEFGHHVSQADAAAWLRFALMSASELDPAGKRANDYARAHRSYGLLSRASGIGQRRTVLADYTHRNPDAMVLFRRGTNWAPPLHERMSHYREALAHCTELALQNVAVAPSHIIHVSCTGYVAPSPIAAAISQRRWPTRLAQLGHMGCAAAIPALTVGAGLAGSAAGSTYILNTEFCTLHLEPATTEPEKMVINTLFADGATLMRVARNPDADVGFALLGDDEVIIPGTAAAMAWEIAGGAFQMTLADSIPAIIYESIGATVSQFLAKHRLTLTDIGGFAIHPGGIKILSAVAEALQLAPASYRHARGVLQEHGNMSSATLPHVWWELARDRDVAHGTKILSIGFGPGITVALNLMEKFRHGHDA